MRRNIPALQRSFRKQKQEKDESAVLEKSNRLLEATAKLDRQRSFRQKREKQLRSLEILPARKLSWDIWKFLTVRVLVLF